MFAEHTLFLWIAFGLIALTAAAAVWFDPAAHKINSRVAEFEERYGRNKRRLTSRGRRHGAMPALLARVASIIPSTRNASETLHARLAKGGVYNPSASSTFLGVQTMLTVTPLVVGAIGMVVLHWPLKLAGGVSVATAAIGWLTPRLWLDGVVKSRHILLRRSLPDFLDLMIVCLQGGLSVQETIRRVSDELRLAHPVLAGELSIVQKDVELGATVDQALRRFAIRSDYDGVRTLSSFANRISSARNSPKRCDCTPTCCGCNAKKRRKKKPKRPPWQFCCRRCCLFSPRCSWCSSARR